jgi:ribosomal protein L40E
MAQVPPCPYCGATAYELHDRRWLTCKSCGQEFDVQRQVCHSCGTLNPIGAAVCVDCQAALGKDTVQWIIETRTKTRKDWWEERATASLDQKQGEQEASQKRMAAFVAEERERQAATARARAEARKRERRVLVVVGIVGGGLILLFVVLSLIFVLAPPADGEDDVGWLLDAPGRYVSCNACSSTLCALPGTWYASNSSGLTQAASISSSLGHSSPST